MKGRRKSGKGAFDPEDVKRVEHTKLGVWDFYQERHPTLDRIPGVSTAESYLQMYQSLPYVYRMVKDIGSIRYCWIMLSTYLLLVVLGSLIPAVSLWYSSQLLKIVSLAVFLKDGIFSNTVF